MSVKTYEVIHKNLYIAAGGKRQKVAQGTRIKLNAEQAKGFYDGKVRLVEAVKEVDLAEAATKAKAEKVKK